MRQQRARIGRCKRAAADAGGGTPCIAATALATPTRTAAASTPADQPESPTLPPPAAGPATLPTAQITGRQIGAGPPAGPPARPAAPARAWQPGAQPGSSQEMPSLRGDSSLGRCAAAAGIMYMLERPRHSVRGALPPRGGDAAPMPGAPAAASLAPTTSAVLASQPGSQASWSAACPRAEGGPRSPPHTSPAFALAPGRGK